MSSQLANDRRIYLQTAADLSPHFPESAHLSCVCIQCAGLVVAFLCSCALSSWAAAGCTHSSGGHFHDLLVIVSSGVSVCGYT